MTPRKAQVSSGKLRHTRAQEPSPSFTRRRIPQEPVRFNGALARLSFSVVLMSSMTSSSGERFAAHVARPHRSHRNHRPDSITPPMVLPKASSLSPLASESIETGDGRSLARPTRLRSARTMISRRLASLTSCPAATPGEMVYGAFRSKLFPLIAVSATAIVRFVILLSIAASK